MRPEPHPRIGDDVAFELPHIALRHLVGRDLLHAVVEAQELQLVIPSAQPALAAEIDRHVKFERHLLDAVEKDGILIEEAEPMAVGTPRLTAHAKKAQDILN